MDGDYIRFDEGVKVALAVADTVPAELDERKTPTLRTPLIQSFDAEAGDLSDFLNAEESI